MNKNKMNIQYGTLFLIWITGALSWLYNPETDPNHRTAIVNKHNVQ